MSTATTEPSSWPASCRPRPVPAVSPSTNGWKCGPSWQRRPTSATDRLTMNTDAVELRELAPRVLSVLVRRGADFAPAEDALQEALIRALAAWGDDEMPDDPTGWLVTVAWRAFLDMTRSET